MKMSWTGWKKIGGAAVFAALCASMVLMIALGTDVSRLWKGENSTQTAMSDEIDRNTPESDADAMQEYRTQREQLRAMQQAQLEELINDSSASDELRDEARKKQMEILQNMEAESIIEGVLMMRGYADAVASVRQDSVNVLVKAQNLSNEEANMILELVCREAGVNSGDVKIIPIN